MTALRGFALALIAAACFGGCDATDVPVCDAALPPAARILARPEFASLRYYLRTNYEPMRGAGFDIWADSKFDYRAALQYSIVPYRPSAREGGQYCARSIALRIAWPVEPAQEKMLSAFVAEASRSAGLDAAAVEARVRDALASGSRYRALTRQGAIGVEAGRVTPASRGEFFVVGFDWSP